MKVKIIERESSYELERAVNDFLKQINISNVLDIKYCGEGNHASYSISRYSVMIIMKG